MAIEAGSSGGAFLEATSSMEVAAKAVSSMSEDDERRVVDGGVVIDGVVIDEGGVFGGASTEVDSLIEASSSMEASSLMAVESLEASSTEAAFDCMMMVG